MSIAAMTTIWKTCCYQGGRLVLLLAMADYGKDDGTEIYPGLDLLAAKCRSSVRGIQDQLKKLRADGIVKILDVEGNDLPDDEVPVGGRGRKTEYRIDLERLQELHALHQKQNPECEYCMARSKRVKRVTEKGAVGRITKDAAGRANGAATSVKDEDLRVAYRIEPSEPSLNLPPNATRAPEGDVALPSTEDSEMIGSASTAEHVARLARMFDPEVLRSWFTNCHFRAGPPLTLMLDRRMHCNWVREKFGDRLRRAFGDDLAFGFQRERVTEDV